MKILENSNEENMHKAGLGELLRHLIELTDQGSEELYKKAKVPIKPRYTPILRAITDGKNTVSSITKSLRITQGAVSQTIKLMEADAILLRKSGQDDARESFIELTSKGKTLVDVLQEHWQARFLAIETLEQEIQIPILANLQSFIEALEEKSYANRILEAEHQLIKTGRGPK